MADRRNIETPTGSPHDIAMMAYRIAERAMAHIERHEQVCSDRWEIQRRTMEALRQTAESNFKIGAADRQDMRESLEKLRVWTTSIVTRVGTWLIVTMAGGLVGAVWFIVTHKWV